MFSSMPSNVNFSFFLLDILLAGGGRSGVGIVMGEGDSANESTSARGSGTGLSSLDLFLLRERLWMRLVRLDFVLLEILALASLSS